MKLMVYKGFEKGILEKVKCNSLLDISIEDKNNVLLFDNDYKRKLIAAITSMSADSWITYNEFAFLCADDSGDSLLGVLNTFGIELHIVLNNIFPEIYRCDNIPKEFLEDFLLFKESENDSESVNNQKLNKVFNEIVKINDEFYARYYNVEYDFDEKECSIEKYYLEKEIEINDKEVSNFIFEISDNEELYVEKINELLSSDYKNIGIKLMGETNRIIKNFESLKAFLTRYPKFNVTSYDKYGDRQDLSKEFTNIANSILKIPSFKNFKDLSFYSNPTIDNSIIKINQSQIMSDMVCQAENALECELLAKQTNGKKLKGYRDIFVTAPTGAGKSVMFQIPAIYLANKYNALTIIITPLIELMNDQIRNLHNRGYKQAERLNSSVNQIEKENIKKGIEEGRINLLYLAPETLLSYSIDQLIGNRRIGLVIIDEAHIVSTWGKGFRPDYWYLGSYLGRLRKFSDYRGIRDSDKAIYCFPICTFTATAVHGGIYDDVSDIKNSLGLRDTITYFGNVIRDNIMFDVNIKDDKHITNKDLYFEAKGKDLKKRIDYWIRNDEKTIVYFPYASTARAAFEGSVEKGFGDLLGLKDKLAIYTGGANNMEERNDSMLAFRDGEKKIMLATKAFGMGIDISDINNVYHYAASGNLNDYVQEIGRCARSANIVCGVAITDYYKRDLNFMKTLYGMSALHDCQVRKILAIIYGVYKNKRRSNLLVTPDMFKSVFPDVRDDSDLEVKIKTALLTIEKDLENRYKGSRTIVVRPRNMFTECFMMINRDIENNILKSEYGPYFRFLAPGRVKELTRDGARTTDIGDIYTLDLKGLWENKFSSITFGEFKHKIFSNQAEIFNQFSHALSMRQSINISSVGDYPLYTVKEKLHKEIDTISEVLNEFQISGNFFAKDEFAEKINEIYHNKMKSELIAGSYLDMLQNYRDIRTANFCEIREISGEFKYRITQGTFRSIAERVVDTSSLIRKISRCNENSCVFYEAITNRKDEFDAINLAILFGLINFEVIGGNKPEIFIRVNYPDKIKHFVDGKVLYNNVLIKEARERHTNDVMVLNHFFMNLDNNEERWDFIENYYLGNVFVEDEKVVVKKISNFS